MGKARWMTGSLLAMMMLTGGAPSAQAQFQPRQNYPQDQDLPGDAPAAQDEGTSPPSADEDFSDVVAADRQRADTPDAGSRQDGQDDRAPDTMAERDSDAVVNSCALAAREEAEREGGYAEVRQMEEPRETRNGYDVDGDVETRSGWRAQDGALRHFTCSVQDGRVADVFFRRDRAVR